MFDEAINFGKWSYFDRYLLEGISHEALIIDVTLVLSSFITILKYSFLMIKRSTAVHLEIGDLSVINVNKFCYASQHGFRNIFYVSHSRNWNVGILYSIDSKF